jgi:histidyl-tRNA synthetase
LGGGRYDKLYQELGGIDLPAIGFAVGIERLANYLETSQPSSKLLKISRQIDIFFLATTPEAYLNILTWKERLEKYSLFVDYNLEVRERKALPKIIDYYQPRLIIILGEKELKSEKILIKDCQKKQEFLIEKERLEE